MRRLLAATGLVVVMLVGLGITTTPANAAVGAQERAPSATFELPLPAKQFAPPANACPYYHLCIWKDSYYGSYQKNFYYCGLEDLSWQVWAWLDWVEDDMSSLENDQTPGTISKFYDEMGDSAYLSQRAHGYRDNLVIDGWNDRISVIHVC